MYTFAYPKLLGPNIPEFVRQLVNLMVKELQTQLRTLCPDNALRSTNYKTKERLRLINYPQGGGRLPTK